MTHTTTRKVAATTLDTAGVALAMVMGAAGSRFVRKWLDQR